MGLSCSSIKDLESNEYLLRLTSNEVITPNDPIWNKLFSHSVKPSFNKEDDFLLDGSCEKLRNQFITNNLTTHNFSALVKVFVVRANELKLSVQTSDTMFLWQAYNAMYIIRNILKFFIETLSVDELPKQFQQLEIGSIEGESDIMELLIESLVRLITELPVKRSTYMLHLEAVNTLIVILSAQMFLVKPVPKLHAYRILLEGNTSLAAVQMTQVLLTNYFEQNDPTYPEWYNDDSGSIVIGVANGIWNILKKGVGLGNNSLVDELKHQNLSNHSLSLLLVLVNHCATTQAQESQGEVTRNPYRDALSACGNETGTDDGPPGTEAPSFKISYSKLFNMICQNIDSDDSTLLLYMLVHRNLEFKSYIMARSDIEQLVLPILKTLYNAATSPSHHIYMSLIILLILSEEDLFNQQVHDVSLKSIPWYTERSMTEISLGGLIILVVIRTIQYNILKMRDKYLHTNCLAALANMSSKFRSLHPYVAQRLVSLFETLGKRHSKLVERIKPELLGSDPEQNQDNEMVQDLSVLEEVLRMILEILNSTLSHQLAQNKHLVYTLMYKKHVFDSFRQYDSTQDLICNLDTVINYFTKRLGSEHKDLSVSQVMERIDDGVLHWKPEILQKFPDLKFRYVEEEQPEEFFIPYLWTLIYKKCGIYWSSANLSLINLDNENDTSNCNL